MEIFHADQIKRDHNDRCDPQHQKYHFGTDTEHQDQKDQRNDQDRRKSSADPFLIISLKPFCPLGKIVAHEVAPGREIVVQKSGFLAAEAGVDLSIFFQKRIGSGIFGGEGFIMQKLSGRGMAFLEFDGHVVEYELQPGQQIVVDTGYLAAMDATCSMEIQSVPGVKNMLFGGEGVFNTVISGPGHIWLQTMPISNVAGVLAPFLPVAK